MENLMTFYCDIDGFPHKIYDITYDSTGYPQFLIRMKGQWVRKSAKHFMPHYVPLDENRYEGEEELYGG